MKHAAKKQWLVAAVFTILAGTVGGVNAGAVSLPAKDHLFVRGNYDNVEKLVEKGGYIYGITPSGKEDSSVYLDKQTFDSLKWIGAASGALGNYGPTIKEVITGIQNNTTSLAGNIEIPQGSSTLTLGDYGKDYVRYYGVLGGDTVVNANLHMITPSSSDISVTRTGNNNIQINGGSVIGGAAGGTAAGIGNVDVSVSKSIITLSYRTNGNASTTLDGSVTTNAAPNANLLGYVNGGLAAGIGGTANSTVTGNTELTITGTDRVYKTDGFETPGNDIVPQITTALNVMKGSGINAIGVTGGGAAVTTLGGTANSVVEGDTTINVTNGTVIAAFGGGAAASVDATRVYNYINKDESPVGNNDGTVTVDGEQLGNLIGYKLGKDNANVVLKDAIQGGEAKTTTGDTHFKIEGKSAGIGVFGGGAAVSTHGYKYRDNNTKVEGYDVGDELGSSVATSNTGIATIEVNMSVKPEPGQKSSIIAALKNAVKQVGTSEPTSYDVLKDFAGSGTVVGLFGGGMSVADSVSDQNKDGNGLLADKNGNGSFATTSTSGAEIYLNKGYGVGVFGGGMAVTHGNAIAKAAMTDSVNINIGKDMETVGVFGNGLAYFTGFSNDGKNQLNGKAEVTGTDANIIVDGKADGVFGGGLAIDDSQSDTVNAISDLSGKVTINVANGAEVKAVNFGAVVNGGTLGTEAPDIEDYAQGANASVGAQGGNVAVAGGGVALGGGAKASVGEAEINITGKVDGNVIAGGVASYGTGAEGSGSTVGISTINLYTGAEITKGVYAGGAVANPASGGYTQSKATVDTAIIKWNGAAVDGILSGGGLKDGEASDDTSVKAVTSTLNLIGENTLSLVDGASKVQGFTQTTAQKGSVTIIKDITAGNQNAVIDAKDGTVTVESGASLDISKLEKSEDKYLIAGNYNTVSSTFWENDDLLYDRFSGYATVDNDTADGGKYTISYSKLTKDNAGKAADEFAGRLDAPWTKPLIEKGMTDGFGDYTGSKTYFSDWNKNRDTASETYNRGGLVGEDTAVTGNTISIASDMADHVVQRLSFTEEYIAAPGWVNEDGGIWAKYVHKKYEAKGLGSTVGAIHASSDYDGAIVGMDFAKKGKLQYGAAFHYGTGEGNGVISSNDYDAWGLALYGSLKDEAAHTNLMADIGYTKTSNDITGHVNGKSLTADRDVDVWTLGVRGEKEYISGRNQVVPYAGLRYIHTAPSRYTSYYDGQKAFDYDAENQDIWLLPVGVFLRNETVTASGWKVTPKVDLSYIWAFGDTDGTTDVWMNGGVSSLAYTVMDDSWLAAVGVEATKDVWSYGLGYSYQKGDDTKSTKWYVSASYAF